MFFLLLLSFSFLQWLQKVLKSLWNRMLYWQLDCEPEARYISLSSFQRRKRCGNWPVSPSDREEPPEAIHVVAQGLVQHRCLKCGCIEMISYKIRYQQLDCKIPLSKENNASYGPLLNCLCQILTLPPTLPSICIFWLLNSG